MARQKSKKNQIEFMAIRNMICKPVDRPEQITENAKNKTTKHEKYEKEVTK